MLNLYKDNRWSFFFWWVHQIKDCQRKHFKDWGTCWTTCCWEFAADWINTHNSGNAAKTECWIIVQTKPVAMESWLEKQWEIWCILTKRPVFQSYLQKKVMVSCSNTRSLLSQKNSRYIDIHHLMTFILQAFFHCCKIQGILRFQLLWRHFPIEGQTVIVMRHLVNEWSQHLVCVRCTQTCKLERLRDRCKANQLLVPCLNGHIVWLQLHCNWTLQAWIKTQFKKLGCQRLHVGCRNPCAVPVRWMASNVNWVGPLRIGIPFF